MYGYCLRKWQTSLTAVDFLFTHSCTYIVRKMTTVTISQGKLRGGKSKTENGFEYYEFFNIPYAKPPVGELRFKSPQTPDSWDDERDATVFDSKEHLCYQMNFINRQLHGSEDCLYLNVYTPSLQTFKSKLLAVMVYIHAGGFMYSNGINKLEASPDFLVEHNVVVVTINYRLGVFGFLNLDLPEAAGNMGLKDQVKALKWIQENIHVFGGDKDNVTILGFSAGSASAEYLLLSPLAKGLFHKAIMQSGSTLNHWAFNYKPKKIILELLNRLGYTGPTEDNRLIYEYLFHTPAPLITQVAYGLHKNYTLKRLFFGFVPTAEIDFGNGETFLTKKPYELLREGVYNKIPMIRGFSNREGELVKIGTPDAIIELTKNRQFTEHWSYSFNDDDDTKFNSKLSAVYFNDSNESDEYDEFALDFFGDLDIVAGVWRAGNIASNNGAPTFFYQFSYEGKANFFKSLLGLKCKGAAHCDDQSYIIRHNAIKVTDENDVLTKNRLSSMWTNFAKTSVPTPSINDMIPVQWPMFTEDTPAYLDIGNNLTIKYNHEPNKMAVFEEIYNKYER